MATRQEVMAQQKPTRTPMGRRNTLTVSGLTDTDRFQYRWFNDQNDRLARAIDAGYIFVDKYGKAAGDTAVDTARGTDSLMRKGVGFGVFAYLMKIPREIYDADQAAKQADVDRLEADMKQAARDRTDGRYGSLEIDSRK